MKLNILFAVIFISVIAYASANFMTGIVGTTQLNGEGCTCHSLTPSSSVNVWIEGPDTVAMGETVQYRIFLEGGPGGFGGFNVAAFSGDLSSSGTAVIEIDDELTHSFPQAFPIAQPTDWTFNYTPTTEGWDTLYSAGNSVNGNNIPTGDEWNFGAKFPVFVTPPVPVELVSFNVKTAGEKIILNWITASELNNKGFEVERSTDKNNFITIGFVEGKGTTTSTNSYSFIDTPGEPAEYYYLLKQIDFDGTLSYSNIVSTQYIIAEFELHQNYPNPFNPETVISFSLPSEGYLTLKIFDITGEEIEVLTEGNISPGYHSFKWDASKYSSGIYFYQINFRNFSGKSISEVRKMILSK